MPLYKLIITDFNIQYYINEMWEKQRFTRSSLTQNYPSKIISDLMNSDTQEQEDDHKIKKNNFGYEKSALSKKYEGKENINVQSNRRKEAKQVKFHHLKVSELAQSSLNLQDDVSMIKGGDEILLGEIEKLREQLKSQIQKNSEFQNENRLLKRQLNLKDEQIQTKDNFYEEQAIKLQKNAKQLEKLIKKNESLQVQLQEFRSINRQQKKAKDYSQFNSRKRNQSISHLIEHMKNNNQYNSSNSAVSVITQLGKNNEGLDTAYNDISQYLMKRVTQLRSQLLEHRMSRSVEDILDEFMTQIVNVNPITVTKTITKMKNGNATPIRHRHINSQGDNTLVQRRQVQKTIEVPSRTPAKEQRIKEKSAQLQNLQKSLQKLREMSKKNGQQVKEVQDYRSLQRSSVLDRSTKSKSRRKKIFE